MFALVGCIPMKPPTSNEQTEGEYGVDIEIQSVEFDGHEYLLFVQEDYTCAVIHNPNCKCKTRQNEYK